MVKTLQYSTHRQILNALSDADIIWLLISFYFHMYAFLLVHVQEKQIDNGSISRILTLNITI